MNDPYEFKIQDALAAVLIDSDPELWYELRYTPQPNDGNTTLNDVADFCKKIADSFVIGEENAHNHHFHCAVYKPKLTKLPFRDLLYSHFKPTILGNAVFKFSPIKKTVEEFIPYCVKDNKYLATPDLLNTADFAYSISFEKPQGYERDVQALYLKFQSSEINHLELWESIGLTRTQYDLRLNLTQLYELVNSQIVKKHPSKLRTLIDEEKFI